MSKETPEQSEKMDSPPAQTKGRPRSYSVTSMHPSGIPLGSITAQLASKSFWTGTMLQERLKQIAHTVLQETYSPVLPGSMCYSYRDSSNDVNKESNNRWDHDLSEERELRTPCSSVGESSVNSQGIRTPPYLSPGVTRRLQWRDDIFL